jgi:hypothetical protein
MGWDGTDLVDGMIPIEVIPCFVWFQEFRDGMECD